MDLAGKVNLSEPLLIFAPLKALRVTLLGLTEIVIIGDVGRGKDFTLYILSLDVAERYVDFARLVEVGVNKRYGHLAVLLRCSCTDYGRQDDCHAPYDR